MGGERQINIEPIQDAEGCLIGTGSVLIRESDYERRIQEMAQLASPIIVALRVNFGDITPFLWIDGEILPGKELRSRFSELSKSPELSDLVVISRTGTIFTAKEDDSVISSRPKPTPGVK